MECIYGRGRNQKEGSQGRKPRKEAKEGRKPRKEGSQGSQGRKEGRKERKEAKEGRKREMKCEIWSVTFMKEEEIKRVKGNVR